MSLTEQTKRRPVQHAPVLPESEPPLEIEPLPAKKRLSVRKLVTALVVLGIVAVGTGLALNMWLDSRQYESTDDAFIDGDIIPISPQVAARVTAVAVNDNQVVKKGDVLVALDDTDYRVALDQKKAVELSMDSKVNQAMTQLDVAKAQVGQALAAVDVAKTNALNMQQNYDRMTGLDPRARSQQQMDDATANQRTSAANVEQAQAQVTAAQAQVADAQAAVTTAKSDALKAAADTRAAEIQLGYCTITAPCDGIVTRKDIEPGEYVTVGQPLCSIVPTDVWVTANFKETQLDQMRPGQEALLFIDAFPERTYHGRIQSIQSGTGSRFSLLPPENATGNFVKVVQRVPVKIELDAGENDDPDHRLSPGMSVIPKVRVRPRESLGELLGISK